MKGLSLNRIAELVRGKLTIDEEPIATQAYADQHTTRKFGYDFVGAENFFASSIDGFFITMPFDGTTLRSNPQKLRFNADGSKVYMPVDSYIVEYNLETPYSIGALEHVDSVNLSTQATTIESFAFNDTGTKMYVLSDASTIYQYTLSPAYDVSTASYDTVSAIKTNARSIEFNPTGTKLFYLNDVSDAIYSATLTTGWDLSTVQSDDATNMPIGGTSGVGTPDCITFTPDGLSVFTTGAGAVIMKTDLDTAWTLQTTSVQGERHQFTPYPDAGTSAVITGISFNDTGDRMFITSDSPDFIAQVNLETAYDTFSAYRGIERVNLYAPAETATTIGITSAVMSNDGTKMIVFDTTANYIVEYTLSSPFDLSTLTRVAQLSMSTYANAGIFISPDGKFLYSTYGGSLVYRHSFATPWDISSITLNESSFDATAQTVSVLGVAFNDTGTKMYLGGTGAIYEYSVSAWAVSGATYTDNLALANMYPTNISFTSDGLFVGVNRTTNDEFSIRRLTTAWDVSTAGAHAEIDYAPFTTDNNALCQIIDSGRYLLTTDNNSNVFKIPTYKLR